jgi:hypothetical protein
MDNDILEYINNMNEKEKIAFDVAVKFLGSSFDIVKSIGFIKYKNSKIINKNIKKFLKKLK